MLNFNRRLHRLCVKLWQGVAMVRPKASYKELLKLNRLNHFPFAGHVNITRELVNYTGLGMC